MTKSIRLLCVALGGFIGFALIGGTPIGGARADEPATLPATAPATQPADARLLQGTWVVVRKVKNGAEEAVKKDAALMTFAGEQVFATADGKDSGSGRFTIDATTDPKRMVLRAVTGPYAGRTFSAIYELDGNTLKLVYSTGNDNEARPKDFTGGENEALEVLEKQKL